MADPIRYLSLFAGIGGLDLAVHRGLERVGLGAQCVGLVEGEAFAAVTLAAAMERGALAPCPIWLGDVREFPAESFRGSVDLVVAGFPCPPVSSAGKRRGVEDERWLWPEVVRCLRDSGARYLFVENVRGLLSANGGRAFGDVLGDLADLGFDAEWIVRSAADVGAPHRRERVFVLADGQRRGLGERASEPLAQRAEGRRGLSPACDGGAVAHRSRGGLGEPRRAGDDGRPALGDGERVDDADRGGGWPRPFPPGPGDRAAWAAVLEHDPALAPAVEPGLRDVADGVPARLVLGGRADQLRGLGNAVVPECGAIAFAELWRRLR